MPERVVANGHILYIMHSFEAGREVWQTFGGMELGSVWGHGGYVAPDWGADWLHRDATTLLDIWAQSDVGKPVAALGREDQGTLTKRLRSKLRTKTYDPANGTITVSADRWEMKLFESGAAKGIIIRVSGVRVLLRYYLNKGSGARRRISARFAW